MLGILVLLIASWLLLYLTTKDNLKALGVLPSWLQLCWVLIGFIITAALCVEAQLVEAWLMGGSWQAVKNVEWLLIRNATWWDVKSVLTEELVFRGALLYLLWHYMGSKVAVTISASAFGIYHWFSFGVLGHFLPMILVFLGTGLMGVVLAWSFIQAKSLWAPFGIHLGWNFTQNTLFSKGPLGTLAFELKGGQAIEGWASLFNFINNMLIPPLVLLLILYWFQSKYKANPPNM
ncbi:MAG: CPBP family intramembrane metalloprotease [Xanthomonadales bacterium]|nr:CPBP family intramembrane metalloprotease [Xanthomonadales bacterium]